VKAEQDEPSSKRRRRHRQDSNKSSGEASRSPSQRDSSSSTSSKRRKRPVQRFVPTVVSQYSVCFFFSFSVVPLNQFIHFSFCRNHQAIMLTIATIITRIIAKFEQMTTRNCRRRWSWTQRRCWHVCGLKRRHRHPRRRAEMRNSSASNANAHTRGRTRATHRNSSVSPLRLSPRSCPCVATLNTALGRRRYCVFSCLFVFV